MIKKESIEILKNSLNIVDTVSSYMELTRAGSNYKGLCPFHNEETPSFVVSRAKNIYHCFGCGESGDSISFVMKKENISYPEALEKLADANNITLEYTKTMEKALGNEALTQAKEFFQVKLKNDSDIIKYLLDRGLTKESIKKFEIGVIKDGGELVERLRGSSLIDNGIETGLLMRGNHGVFCRFNQRVMIPIFDSNSKIVGFGGRTIINDDAKYINSPQTKLFNKSRLFYGFNFAKNDIYKKEKIIITEGYLDVIMLHQAGFTNAVATLGTSLTKDHIPLLSKTNAKIYLAYDGDKAGVNAALRASNLLISHKKDGYVILFHDGLDPADMIKDNKIEELENLLSNPIPIIEFVINNIVSGYDMNSIEDKDRALNEIKRFLSSLTPLLREEYKRYVANIFKIDIKIFDMETLKNPKQNRTKRAPQQETKAPTRTNFLELTLLATLMEDGNESLIDYVLEYIDSEFFKSYRREFEIIKSGDFTNPNLASINILGSDSSIVKNDEFDTELDKLLVNLSLVHFEDMLKSIKMSDMDETSKFKRIKIIMTNIKELKSGHLVHYTSDL